MNIIKNITKCRLFVLTDCGGMYSINSIFDKLGKYSIC